MAEDTTEKEPFEKKEPLFRDYLRPYGSKLQRKIICTKPKKTLFAIILIMLFLNAIGQTAGLSIDLRNQKSLTSEYNDTLPTQIPVGAVVTDHEICSDVGRDILAKGGTAVDAAISALLCNGVATPHSMGIGGGCFMVIYNKTGQCAVAIDGREVAPMAANATLFSNFSEKKFSGGELIGVPGELMAYKKAHDIYGSLPWKTLFEPAIKIAEEGYPLGNATAKALSLAQKMLKLEDHPYFCEMFCKDGRVLKEGETVQMLKFAQFLKRVADDGPNIMYKDNDVMMKLVEEINQAGGIFDKMDFINYEPKIYTAEEFDIRDYKVFTTGAPSGGPVLELILNILKGFNITSEEIANNENEAELIHKVIEAFKFADADRLYLGDPNFVNITKRLQKMKSRNYAAYIRDRIDLNMTHNISYYTNLTAPDSHSFGTSHVSVLSPNGDAVSVTSSINYYFGSLVISNSTGIIWNNQMKDFRFKKDKTSPMVFEANKVEPSKRPLSSIVPVILTDIMGNVKMVVGAAGGSSIAHIVAQILSRVLWLNQTLTEAVAAQRFSPNLHQNKLSYEGGMSEELLELLKGKGHQIKTTPDPFIGVVEGILVENGQIEAVADTRKIPGKPSYVFSNISKTS